MAKSRMPLQPLNWERRRDREEVRERGREKEGEWRVEFVRRGRKREKGDY